MKLVRTVSRVDGCLVLEKSNEKFADAYLSKGWTVIGVLRGDTSNEVLFVMQQESGVAAAAEIIEEAEVIDTSALHEFG